MLATYLVGLCTFVSLFYPARAHPTTSNNKISTAKASQRLSRFSLDVVKRASHTPRNLGTRDAVTALTVDQSWYVPVAIGTPPQQFLLNPDAAAPDFTLFSVDIPPDHHTNNLPLYDPRKSATAKQVDGVARTQTYVGGERYSGTVYTDIVTVGTISLGNFGFEVCNQTTVPTIGGTASGTLGLNYKQTMPTSPIRIMGWFPTVMSQLQDPVFTVDYNPQTRNGTFDFGFIDENKFTGDIVHLPVMDNAQSWQVNISGLRVYDTFYLYPFSIMIDTGDPGSSIPPIMLDLYFKDVKGAVWTHDINTYTYDCDAELPDLVFGMGDQSYGIPGKNLEGATVIEGRCYFLVTGEEDVLWGQILIENTFMVFDMGMSRVGFASKM